MNELETISWSTDAIRPSARLNAWRTFLVDTFRECDMDYAAEGDFWATMKYSRYGDINVGRIAGSSRSAVRTQTTAKTGTDGVVMSIACSGRYQFTQAGREQLLEPGEAYFFHNCLPGAFAADEGGEYWLVSLPAHAIIPGFGDSESLVGCRISEARPELKLLSNYLQAVSQISGLNDPNTRSVIGRQITDLIIAAVGRANDASQAAGGRGIRAARYRLVLEEIGRRFNEPMLNAERIARALGVSERYVQQLFEENDSTVSGHILAERLKAARRMLADPNEDGRTISDIAYGCGFSDISYFNRAYRKKFGDTPNGARKQR